MKANYKPRRGATYAEKLNVLRGSNQDECISLGLHVGVRLALIAVNQELHIANDRLTGCYATAAELWESEFKADPELATERMMAALNRIMGDGWEEKAIALMEQRRKEGKRG